MLECGGRLFDILSVSFRIGLHAFLRLSRLAFNHWLPLPLMADPPLRAEQVDAIIDGRWGSQCSRKFVVDISLRPMALVMGKGGGVDK